MYSPSIVNYHITTGSWYKKYTAFLKFGLTKSVISAYETGLRLPSYDVLIHIAQIFKVSTDYLLGVEQKDSLDLSGLTQNEKSALLALIKAMKSR